MMNDLKSAFAKNLRERRKELGLTQQMLGECLNYTEKTVSKWESGKSIPNIDVLFRLSDFLGIDIYKLFDYNTDTAFYLGIDGGATGTEFALADSNGRIIKTVLLGSSNPYDIGMKAAQGVLEDGIRKALSGISYSNVSAFAGISGGKSGGNGEILTNFLSRFGFRSYKSESDIYNAVSLALDDGNGIVAIAGTGTSICIAKDGTYRKIGGFGYLFDKGCSGYDIGAAGISAALKSADGIGKKTLISELISNKIGGNAVDNLTDFYNRGKTYIASFAPLVFEAYSNGDAVAVGIVKDSVYAFVQQVAVGLKDLEPKDRKLVIVGGITSFEDILSPLLQSFVELQNVSLSFCKEKPVLGAVRLAMKL